ncbi:hypothetical protein [Streptomyces sp. FL07-04A]|uniref:hypothetical protein n=1 Tax=Streptomyces sp. FL07-04A TaxID=3028658 RepID=UPI0029AFA22A|nr:hypothetical protein [Streptomyces sp. FL07-04A]MDX3575942.1 hypothetical protein [Streptomyces sp. FL07-04A]
MNRRALTCTRCGAPVIIAEDISGHLDWGLAVIGDDGVVRREEWDCEPRVLMADNSEAVGRPRACCTNPDCRHQWRLRRPFDPAAPTP